MSNAYMITPVEDDFLTINAEYFSEELKGRWPNAQFHFVSDPNASCTVQWEVQTEDGHKLIGNLFKQTGISFDGINSLISAAKFAIWFRTIISSPHRLFFYTEALEHEPIEI